MMRRMGFDGGTMDFLFLMLLLVLVRSATAMFFRPFNVSYDHRALIIDGQRRMLISAGIHYPRATPEMWPGLIAKSKEAGVDVIQTYVFWNGHEPRRGQYNFEGRYDLVRFARSVASTGLYLHLRIGPYVCAEWNFGGFPVWLRDIPGIQFRTNNEHFKNEMKRFVMKIVDMMKQEMLFSWQGGPIILMQIENEYGNIEGSYGYAGKQYVKWAASMALELGVGVPWVMCKQTDAPKHIIDSCNAFYCDGFRPNSFSKPALWTEDWNGWYASWGGRLPHRPVEDNAFAVARFFQRGGSFHNYYMFFGGTNFGRTAGGPLQITSYDYDAPIDEYGLLNFPKWGHLKDLHAAIKLCESAMVSVDVGPQYAKLGPMQEVHIYSTKHIDLNSSNLDATKCSAFLANIDEHKTANVKFLGRNYLLAPWSVSILPDCKHVVYNTAKISSQVSIRENKDPLRYLRTVLSRDTIQNENSYMSENWTYFKEPICRWQDSSFTAEGILEHLNVTKDISDYLWYVTRVNLSEDTSLLDVKQDLTTLVVGKVRDVVRVFVNGNLSGSTVGHWVHMEQPIHLSQGSNEIALVSATVGLQNYGAFLEKDGAGLKGGVKLSGLKNGETDLSNSIWGYKIGLTGELKKIYSPNNDNIVDWTDLNADYNQSTFMWYRTFFEAPAGNDLVALYLGSMGKGQAWVNGLGIGRYWSLVAPKEGCPKTCNYRGAYNENKCLTNCGNPTQDWYHIPRSWLKPSNNLLVLFEETGGNPFKIELKIHATHIICGRVSEDCYPPLGIWSGLGLITEDNSIADVAPEVHLQCDPGHQISEITFASFGKPKGSCQHFSTGKCHAQTSLSVVSEACQGKNSCKIRVSIDAFGDPCHGVLKTLAVEAKCRPSFAVDSLR
ncbi:beta galactosidase 9 isoform X2 [Wolffia australiana]